MHWNGAPHRSVWDYGPNGPRQTKGIPAGPHRRHPGRPQEVPQRSLHLLKCRLLWLYPSEQAMLPHAL